MSGEARGTHRARAARSSIADVTRDDELSIRQLGAELTAMLRAGGIASARDEARDLMAALLDVPRFWPSMHATELASVDLRDSARQAAARRASGAPFAYAVGRAAFRHLTLRVDERVLIPRQETELLVELVLDAGLPPGGIAIDVATGSGAVALALASEGRFARVIATDISSDALSVARENVDRLAPGLHARVDLASGSFVTPAARLLGPERARAIVSNPPYIAYLPVSASRLPVNTLRTEARDAD